MSTTNPIKKLTIKGFKSIRNLEAFDLQRLNVLIGSNGAGKSNFVSYFQMLRELVKKRLQVWTKKQGGADRILTFGVKETKRLESYIEFGYNEYRFVLEPTIDEGFTFTEETTSLNLDGQNPYWGGMGHSESRLKDNFERYASGNRAHECYLSISSWKVFHFHDTSDTAGVKRLGSLHDNDYLRSDASNLAAFLYKLREFHAEDYNQICKTVRLAIPFFDDFVLSPEKMSGDEAQIRLLWRQKDSDYPLWPNQLSDGSIRFICLVTALLQPDAPSTLIIDEPELGLHPYALSLLGALIRSAADRMQVIVSTQSVPLLNEFEVHDLIVVEREDDATVFKRHREVDFKNWLENYSVGELWEKNLLGGRPTA